MVRSKRKYETDGEKEQMKAYVRGQERQKRENKRRIIEENMQSRNDRSPNQQLALLDVRLGRNKGAKKERARLLSFITETK